MEIRNFADVVNKSQLAEDCTKKLAETRAPIQHQLPKKVDRNLAPEGQEFKRNEQFHRRFHQGEGQIQNGPECAKC
ncbi:hypothetical protein PIB30_088887, partial [Stylosanthes scabra]|nr:hypothetical protein [Stylosanthes scabra]